MKQMAPQPVEQDVAPPSQSSSSMMRATASFHLGEVREADLESRQSLVGWVSHQHAKQFAEILRHRRLKNVGKVALGHVMTSPFTVMITSPSTSMLMRGIGRLESSAADRSRHSPSNCPTHRATKLVSQRFTDAIEGLAVQLSVRFRINGKQISSKQAGASVPFKNARSVLFSDPGRCNPSDAMAADSLSANADCET